MRLSNSSKFVLVASTTALPAARHVLGHLAANMASAIEHIHQLDIVHRDIKSDNFLIYHRSKAGTRILNERATELTVKLIDFGLAKVHVFFRRRYTLENSEFMFSVTSREHTMLLTTRIDLDRPRVRIQLNRS